MKKQLIMTDKAQFLYLFELYNCDITSTSKVLGISRSKYYYWIKKDSEFKNKIDEIKNKLR